MHEGVPKLRITSSMSMEQAMLEVRRYLAARSNTSGEQTPKAAQHRTAALRAVPFSMQAAMAGRLSEIAARLGELDPHSKLGAPGVFLKRIVRKAIGWYLRPVHEFDRTAIELLQQIRQDMVGLQQQIAALQEQDTAAQPREIQDRDDFEKREAVSLMIELYKNVTAVQSLRRALRDEDPELLRRVETVLDRIEGESQELKTALTQSLQVGKQ